MPLTIVVRPHPLLDAASFVIRLTGPLGDQATPSEISRWASEPVTRDPIVTTAVRDLLRHGGFKPAGRSKPASEYLAAAVGEGRFPTINPLVDACNVVSLHHGLPISLVDLDRAVPPFEIAIAPPGTSYVFNPSGQLIDAGGLICLFDREGPTGTPVKDAQRTKTHDATTAALVIVWGTRAHPGSAHRAATWYRELVASIGGAATEQVALVSG